MDRGATVGEREAGRAAACRVAAAAGLSLRDAIAALDAGPPRRAGSPGAGRPAPARPAYAWAKPKPPPEPVSVAELLRQREADLARRKKAARRSGPPAGDRADQASWVVEARAAQAERDRDWAERRRRDAGTVQAETQDTAARED